MHGAGQTWVILLRHTLALIAFAFVGVTSVVAGDDPLYPIDSRVTHVWTGGAWESQNLLGNYRITIFEIRENEKLYNDMYVEWMGVSRKKNDEKSTIVFRDTIIPRGFVLESPVCKNPPICKLLSINATNIEDGEDYRFDIRIQNPDIVHVEISPLHSR